MSTGSTRRSRRISASPRCPTIESGLVQVDLPLEAPAFDTNFVYPEELKESKRVAVFRDFIVSKAKEWKY